MVRNKNMMEDGINELLVHVTPSYLYSMPRTPSIGIDLQKNKPGLGDYHHRREREHCGSNDVTFHLTGPFALVHKETRADSIDKRVNIVELTGQLRQL